MSERRSAPTGIACAMAVLMLAACASLPRPSGKTVLTDTQPPTGVAFTDADLEKLLASTDAVGLIYVWSPHMPYSVKGLREILEAGERMGLTVTPLLDPQADARLSVSVIHEQELPHTALRHLHSTTLFERGTTLHFPTLLVFGQGRIGGQMLPGYTSPAVAEAFIQRQSESLAQPRAPVSRL